MLNLQAQFESIEDPFTIHLARGLLDRDQLRGLYESQPQNSRRIIRSEMGHEKQYAMNLLYLVENGERNNTAGLDANWSALIDDLQSSAFMDWLECGTGLQLRHLLTDISMYTHDDGDYISQHTDKVNKALTAILYLNEQWPSDGGGHYEVFRSGGADAKPVQSIAPQGGQLLAFPPTKSSWHAVSPVTAGPTVTRLTVQFEFWLDKHR